MNILCLTTIDHVPSVKEKLSSLGNLVYYPLIFDKRQVRDLILSNGIDVLYVNPNKQKYILDEYILHQTKVKVIVTVSRGTNHIDMDYCDGLGIRVVHLNKDPVTSKNSATAEHALGLTLALIRHIPQSFDSVKSGEWDYLPFMGHQLQSFTVGVIGLGTLGRKYTSYCRAIGAMVLGCTRQSPGSFKNVMSNSDVISLHIPLIKENHHLMDKKAIDLIKPSGAFIINTSRGSIVDEKAIVDGLRSGKIKGYATDILEDETEDVSSNPIVITAKEGLNIIITPHVAGCTFESLKVAHFRAMELLEQSYLSS